MLTHDIHVHTHLSLCAKPEATFDAYVRNARRLGIKLIGFADHMWETGKKDAPSDFYEIQNLAHVLKLRDEVYETEGLRVLIGCEAEFTADNTLSVTPEAAQKLDYVTVAHSHTHFDFVMPQEIKDDYKAHGQWLMESFMRMMHHPGIALAATVVHPMAPCLVDKADEVLVHISDSEFREAFALAAKHSVGLELNAAIMCFAGCDRKETAEKSQFLRMFRIAKECGCRFSLGSDSHHPDDHGNYPKLGVMIDLLGLTKNDFIPLVQ